MQSLRCTKVDTHKHVTDRHNLSDATGLGQGTEVPSDEEWFKGKAQAYANLAKAAQNYPPRWYDPLIKTSEATVESSRESQVQAVPLLSMRIPHTNLLHVRSSGPTKQFRSSKMANDFASSYISEEPTSCAAVTLRCQVIESQSFQGGTHAVCRCTCLDNYCEHRMADSKEFKAGRAPLRFPTSNRA